MESSRRDLLIDMAERSPILKIRTTPVLVSYPKQVQLSPKRGFVFTVNIPGLMPLACGRQHPAA